MKKNKIKRKIALKFFGFDSNCFFFRKMKDMQIQALLGQYVDSGLVQLDDCPIVNQYW